MVAVSLLLIAAWSAVRAVCMLVRRVASAVCSVVKMVVADACCVDVQVQQLGQPATWLATIWAGVGGVGGVVFCAVSKHGCECHECGCCKNSFLHSVL